LLLTWRRCWEQPIFFLVGGRGKEEEKLVIWKATLAIPAKCEMFTDVLSEKFASLFSPSIFSN
jgi:hypothetical protein